MKLINIKIKEEDFEIIKEAAKKAYNKNKHRKDYGYGAYMKESALNRAKRLLNTKDKSL